MDRVGRANREARRKHLRTLTLERAVHVLEELLSNPIAPPKVKAGHPVSLSRRMRAHHA